MVCRCAHSIRKGTLKQDFAESSIVQGLVKKLKDADVVVAPIADNKMFYVMSQLLSASGLGFQYIIKTERALKKCMPIERYYLSVPEREDCRKSLIERGYLIDTKLKLAKRELKEGLYIEELLK